MLRPVFYRSIVPSSPLTLAQLCQHAHVLGYELVPFNGYDPIAPTSTPAERLENMDRLCEIARVEEYATLWNIFEIWADVPPIVPAVAALIVNPAGDDRADI